MPVDERHIEFALDAAGVRGSLVTSWLPKAWEHVALQRARRQNLFTRRAPLQLIQRRLVRQFVPDMLRSYKLATGHPPIPCHDELFRRVDTASSKLVSEQTSAVIGRELGSLKSFTHAKEAGATNIYHLPTPHHETVRTILKRESAVYGDICKSTFDPREFDPERVENKLEELRLSDHIWCPSAFVKNSLVESGLSEDRISVIPYGGESEWLMRPRPQPDGSFLLVGNISARKGAHRLLHAWKKLKAHRTNRLVFIGPMHLSSHFLQDYKGVYEHLPRMPRSKLALHYLRASSLVLPALAEGFALVILEALSCGAPVLASRNSGAVGFLNDDEARFFDAGEDEPLLTALDWALTHPGELEEMGRAGRKRVATWSWDMFENAVLQQIRRLNIA
ncbi:glycosyltransferase involved in cell wall biosynthesis [Roseimicrobium gellanilyticum]|uniref:Glycosyltransferase involved in cell wall biosynthesis n=2 Tax=Roseimicrobium gellanilyticum TaxID=748857 RepID=A0A366HR94_9BACT|nr:glycosyltransferase involved in cell wall biosynthesis [Roseimicrobium gellanilyticum]